MGKKKGGKAALKLGGKAALKLGAADKKIAELEAQKQMEFKPPVIFSASQVADWKEKFLVFDDTSTERVPLEAVPFLFRLIGVNPTNAEIVQLFMMFLEDDLVDRVEYREFLLMLEQKITWGDSSEPQVMDAFRAFDTTGDGIFVDIEDLRVQLMKWGEPFTEIEMNEMIKQATKDGTCANGQLNIVRFVSNMNDKDIKLVKEDTNYWKMDQTELLALALEKAAKEAEKTGMVLQMPILQ